MSVSLQRKEAAKVLVFSEVEFPLFAKKSPRCFLDTTLAGHETATRCTLQWETSTTLTPDSSPRVSIAGNSRGGRTANLREKWKLTLLSPKREARDALWAAECSRCFTPHSPRRKSHATWRRLTTGFSAPRTPRVLRLNPRWEDGAEEEEVAKKQA